MQYEITLPADYDMKIIRHRVATRGSAMDAFPGLGLTTPNGMRSVESADMIGR
ncbi:DUF4865 family protein [Streptosporangium sp. CA-135522]|uniref:DUF4865 family protein n=1 Tax=Streptosporangium sp. CA-135522 TaxID=3240072 RepID=UPI003D8FE2C8